MMLRQWGDKWLAPAGAPVEAVHQTCGHVLHATLSCSACGEALTSTDVTLRPGPGAREGGTLPAKARP